MNMIWETLTHTPWWVYLLFFYLLKIGYDATKTRVVSLRKLFILPTIFLAISINTLLTSFYLSPATIIFYLISLLLGVCAGWLLVRGVDPRTWPCETPWGLGNTNFDHDDIFD